VRELAGVDHGLEDLVDRAGDASTDLEAHGGVDVNICHVVTL